MLSKEKVFQYLDKLRFNSVGNPIRIEMIQEEFGIDEVSAEIFLKEYNQELPTRIQFLQEAHG